MNKPLGLEPPEFNMLVTGFNLSLFLRFLVQGDWGFASLTGMMMGANIFAYLMHKKSASQRYEEDE